MIITRSPAMAFNRWIYEQFNHFNPQTPNRKI